MKIKQVCEQTGLTDRAIRYYIEEGLVSPAYTENYMGRRAYDFTDEDVAALNHVATLRKFGFMVEEIRRILTDPQESIAVLAEVRARKEETLRQEGENLDALARLEAEKAYTVAELAERLAEPVREVEVPGEDRWPEMRERVIGALRQMPVWLMALAPFFLCLLTNLAMMLDYRYIAVDFSLVPAYLMMLLVSLLPTIIFVIGWFRKAHYHQANVLKWFIAVCCVLWLPVAIVLQSMTLFATPFYAQTHQMDHYLQLSINGGGDNDRLYQFFPDQPRTVIHVKDEYRYREQQVDADYYYRYVAAIDVNYEVYAQWWLPQDEIERERERALQLFGKWGGYEPWTETVGDFTCLIWGERPCRWEELAESSHYSYAVFAFDAATGRVRYIWNEGVDVPEIYRPRCFTLDW